MCGHDQRVHARRGGGLFPSLRRLWFLVGFLAIAGMAGSMPATAQGRSATQAPAATVVPLLQVNGPIGPATADYIARGLQRAARNNAPLVVLQIDTPGGLDSSTRQIVKAILASPVPVAAWVAPSGARAASAGAYMVYASHIAAMAPGTNLGAATPVQIGGMPGSPPAKPAAPKQEDGAEEKASGGDAMTRKLVNDSAAYLRALAQLRGRNVDWADRAVREGVSLSAEEAQTEGVIDFIAADLAAVLAQAHGRSVQMGEGALRKVASSDAATTVIVPDWRTRLLSLITDPTVAYLLLLLGIYGIYFELASPGFGLSGVAGAIALLLGMFALQMLPVSYAGIALIVLGFALLVAEAFVPSFGALGIGGVIAFVVGSVMLIDTDTPGFGIPLGLIVSVAVINVLFVLLVFRLALKARQRPVVSGSEGLLGATGAILDVGTDTTWARVHGEHWRVTSKTPLQVGQHVRVTGRDGLVLQVEPDAGALSSTAATASSRTLNR